MSPSSQKVTRQTTSVYSSMGPTSSLPRPQRRLAFHCATLNDPDLLLLDKPTSGMDPLGRAELWQLAREAASGGTGIIITTHYLEEAERCDRVIVHTAGRIAISGTVDDILSGRQVTVIR